MKRRACRATDVKDVQLEEVLKRAPAGAVTVGADIGKEAIYGVLRFSDGTFQRPWKAENPEEVATLVGVLRALSGQRELIVAMEATGSYGEPLRSELAEAGLTVHGVGGKAAHDYVEVFDGVPSQHDGKDAAVTAGLAAFSTRPPPNRSPVVGQGTTLQGAATGRPPPFRLLSSACLWDSLDSSWRALDGALPRGMTRQCRKRTERRAPPQQVEIGRDVGAWGRPESSGQSFRRSRGAA
jgi:hypothetical protein